MQSRRSMRATQAALLAGAAGVSLVVYAQTVNLQPGLYEFVTTVDRQLPPDMVAKMPPAALALMQKPNITRHCISQTDLDHVSQQLSQGRGGDDAQSCKVTDHSISGNQVKFTRQCPRGTMHFEGTFASDSFQGVMVSSGDQGRTFTAKMNAKRVGDCSK